MDKEFCDHHINNTERIAKMETLMSAIGVLPALILTKAIILGGVAYVWMADACVIPALGVLAFIYAIVGFLNYRSVRSIK